MKTAAPEQELTHDEQQAIRHLVNARGERSALKVLQLASPTVARAMAGLPLARTTVSHLRMKLAELAQSPPLHAA